MEPSEVVNKMTVTLSVSSINTLISPIGGGMEGYGVKELDYSSKNIDRRNSDCNSYGGYLDICKHCKHNLVYKDQDCGKCYHVQNLGTYDENSSTTISKSETDTTEVHNVRTEVHMCTPPIDSSELNGSVSQPECDESDDSGVVCSYSLNNCM